LNRKQSVSIHEGKFQKNKSKICFSPKKVIFRFLRSQKSYEPPSDVKQTVSSIVNELGGVKDFQGQKFDLLNRCAATFGDHFVPNSQLFEIRTIGELNNKSDN
jgi:hypothetical protein